MNARHLLRSFATSLALVALTGMAGAQCTRAQLDTADLALVHAQFGASAEPPMSAGNQQPPAILKTSALSRAPVVAKPAARGRAFGTDTTPSRGDAALYAALALMVAIALRRAR